MQSHFLNTIILTWCSLQASSRDVGERAARRGRGGQQAPPRHHHHQSSASSSLLACVRESSPLPDPGDDPDSYSGESRSEFSRMVLGMRGIFTRRQLESYSDGENCHESCLIMSLIFFSSMYL